MFNFKKKKNCDEFGYRLNDIIWRDILLDLPGNQTVWKFYVSFMNDQTKRSIVIQLNECMSNQQRKHPQKLKKQLLQLFESKDIVTCLELLIEKFPNSAEVIIKQIPEELADKLHVSEDVSQV